MTPHIATNYALPTIPNSIKSAATATGTTSSTEASDIGTTFLSLLTKELQNQDPTAPMDSTAMVGQMISLNQLAQLTSINQAVGGATSSATGAVRSTTPSSLLAVVPSKVTQTPSANAATNQLPFDPNTMMPISYAQAPIAIQPTQSLK